MAWWLRDKGGCAAPPLDTAYNGGWSERYRARVASLRKPVMRRYGACMRGGAYYNIWVHAPRS